MTQPQNETQNQRFARCGRKILLRTGQAVLFLAGGAVLPPLTVQSVAESDEGNLSAAFPAAWFAAAYVAAVLATAWAYPRLEAVPKRWFYHPAVLFWWSYLALCGVVTLFRLPFLI